MRRLDVGQQERPGGPDELVRVVDPDVAAPDHRGTGRPQVGHEPGGLRIVHDHDVACLHALAEAGHVLFDHLLVEAAGALVERPPVAFAAVKPVVNPLRELEELGRAVDDEPACVHAQTARVADKRPQQLDDAAAACGRVDVPDHPPLQQPATFLCGPRELVVPLRADDRPEPLGLASRYLHLLRHSFLLFSRVFHRRSVGYR
jgi:hypothetical protein